MLRLAVQHARYTLGATRSLAPFRTAASSPAPGASSRTDAGSGSTASGSTGGQPAISLENASMSWHDELNVRLTTRDTIVGHAVVEEMGIVVGTSARSRSIIHDLIQRIRGIVGGSLTDYEELFANSTAEATHNAMLQAHRLGANAIIRARYESSATDSKLTGVSCFVICYGTAVKLEKLA